MSVVAPSVTSPGATFNTDNVAGVHTPRSKVTWGPAGTINEVDTPTPFPVQIVSLASGVSVDVSVKNKVNVTIDSNTTINVAHTTITALGAHFIGAQAATVNPGPFAVGTQNALRTDHQGKLLFTGYLPGQVFSSISPKISASTAATIFTSAGASVQLWITKLLVTNAGGSGTWVHFLDGSTTIWSGYAGGGGGGFSEVFQLPGLPTTMGNSLLVKCESSVGVEVVAGVVGHTEQR